MPSRERTSTPITSTTNQVNSTNTLLNVLKKSENLDLNQTSKLAQLLNTNKSRVQVVDDNQVCLRYGNEVFKVVYNKSNDSFQIITEGKNTIIVKDAKAVEQIRAAFIKVKNA